MSRLGYVYHLSKDFMVAYSFHSTRATPLERLAKTIPLHSLITATLNVMSKLYLHQKMHRKFESLNVKICVICCDVIGDLVSIENVHMITLYRSTK